MYVVVDYTPGGGGGGASSPQTIQIADTNDDAEENGSGTALFAGAQGSDVYSTTWDGSAWGSTVSHSAGSYNIYWLRLAADPNSDDLLLAYSDQQNDIHTINWTGSAWGAGSYFQSRIWNGSSWDTELGQILVSGTSYWLTLKSDPNSNKLALATIDSGRDLNIFIWSGSTWSTASPMAFELQVVEADTCSSATGWESVADASDWQLVDTSYYNNTDASANVIGGLTDPAGGTFVAGELKDLNAYTCNNILGHGQRL